MVTKLDPDAPNRQSRSIHDLDQVCAYLLLFSFCIMNFKYLILTNFVIFNIQTAMFPQSLFEVNVSCRVINLLYFTDG